MTPTSPPPPGPAENPLPRDPYSALRFPDYRRYFIGNACSLIGAQLTTYTVGYELYKRSHSAFVLGMVGLVQVLPIILLALPAGQLVDRHSRKRLVLIATSVQIVLWIAMGFSSRFSAPLLGAAGGIIGTDPHVPILLALLLINGMCRSINQPAKQSLLPLLVPREHFPNAITWNASLNETSTVLGPMIGGFAVAAMLGAQPSTGAFTHGWTFACIYWVNALLQGVQWVNIARLNLVYTPPPREPVTIQSMFAGVRFVYHNKVILGVITLDMFAVLLGGATALLPVIADQVLHVGPVGLAWLRAAPAIGALTMAMILAHAPPMRHAGRTLLIAVAGFGLATIVFGLSQTFWLSMAALFFTGLFDNISVVVRQTLVQLLTPDAMRGRVNAVNSVFISSSNELGGFESGVTAHLAQHLFGPVQGLMVAVSAGGVGTLLVVAAVALAWPQVAAVRRLARPAEL